MATWFATAAGNINTAGRWNSSPTGGGTTLTWPPAVDDILIANNYIITVNVSVTCAQLRADKFGGATLDTGYFNASAGVTIAANLEGIGAYGYLLRNNSGGAVNVVGNLTPPVNSNYYVILHNSGTTNVTGSVPGGTASNSYGIEHTGAGTVTVTGTVAGGSASNAFGIRNTITGTVTVIGTVAGGTNSAAEGIRNQSTGTVTVTGAAIAVTAPGVRNNAGGTVTITGYAQASATEAGAINTAQGILEVGETRSASNGRGAVTGAFRYASATALVHKPIAADGSVLTMKPVGAFTLPSEATVRQGVSYGADKVGTLTGCNRHHRMSI